MILFLHIQLPLGPFFITLLDCMLYVHIQLNLIPFEKKATWMDNITFFTFACINRYCVTNIYYYYCCKDLFPETICVSTLLASSEQMCSSCLTLCKISFYYFRIYNFKYSSRQCMSSTFSIAILYGTCFFTERNSLSPVSSFESIKSL